MRIPLIAATALAFASILPGKLSAQNVAQPKIKLQFLSFPKRLDLEPLELLVGRETLEIAAPGHEIGPEYKVPPLANIVIGKTVQGEDGKARFDVYGKARAIAAKEQIVLLIRKGNAPSDGFIVKPMDARAANFPGGAFKFINASGKKVGCVIGDQRFSLEPGKEKLTKPKPDHAGEVAQVTFYYEREDGTSKKFEDKRWSTDENFRTMVFFYDLKGKVGVQPILEMLPFVGEARPPQQ